MQPLPVCALLVAMTAALGWLCVGAVDVTCDCRIWHHRDSSTSVHCATGRGGTSKASCQKANVVEVPRGYHHVLGYGLVKLHRTLKPWSRAKLACEQEGAQLASPRSRIAFNGLTQLFNVVKGVHWANLGISDTLNEGIFVGMDGRPVAYIPWKAYQPDNYGGKENCVDLTSAGESNDVICEVRAPFFCERPLSVAIPDDYEWLGDAGRFYKVHQEKHSHAEAAAACRAENASLAVTDTWVRGEALLATFDIGIDTDLLYHIGFTDEATEGDFITETGRHLSDMEFQVWDVDEPNNDDNGEPENCVALARRGYYRDVRCDLQLAFICEVLPV